MEFKTEVKIHAYQLPEDQPIFINYMSQALFFGHIDIISGRPILRPMMEPAWSEKDNYEVIRMEHSERNHMIIFYHIDAPQVPWLMEFNQQVGLEITAVNTNNHLAAILNIPVAQPIPVAEWGDSLAALNAEEEEETDE